MLREEFVELLRGDLFVLIVGLDVDVKSSVGGGPVDSKEISVELECSALP